MVDLVAAVDLVVAVALHFLVVPDSRYDYY